MAGVKAKSKVRLILKIFLALILIVAFVLGGLLLFASATEWKPQASEAAISYSVATSKETLPTTAKIPQMNTEYSALSFNIGFAGLGEESDFFMDGGTHSLPENKDLIVKNMRGIENILTANKPDFLLMQEVDTDAKRSFGINEYARFNEVLKQDSSFAYNLNTAFIPYPMTGFIGKVHSGLYTSSAFPIDKGERVGLTVPFKWPERIFNLKRCLLVNRVPIMGTDKQLVLVNLHLEAYDSTGGRKTQTKAMLDFIQKEYAKGNYVVAGGDWNQAFEINDAELKFPTDETLWKPELFTLQPELKDAGWNLNYGTNAPTARLDNQPYTTIDENTYYYLIDGFITSPNVKINKVETVDAKFKFSDHNPVKLNFELKQN